MKRCLLVLFLFVPVLVNAQIHWHKNYGSAFIDEGLDISSDAAGNLFVTGYFSGVADFGVTQLSSNGVTDIFLAKINSAGSVLWAVKAGGNGSDRAWGIQTDGQGNSVITGLFHGTANFGSVSITANGNEEDMFVAKYDNSGNILWVKSGGGPDSDMGSAVTIDDNDNVIVTGQFKATATFDGQNLTSMNDTLGLPSIDVFVAKYNSSGTLLWLQQGTAPLTDRGLDLTTDPSGNIYVTGQFSDTITFDQVHNNNSYNSIFLIKFDPAGLELWFRRIGGGQYNISYGIATDNNALYMTGDFAGNLTFSGSTNLTLQGNFYQNFFVSKYDFDGNCEWATAEGTDNMVHVRNIAVDSAGNSFVIGDFNCKMTDFAGLYGDGTFNSVGYDDIFVSEFNMNGELQWARHYAGREKDNGFGITLVNGNPAITGSFKNYINYPTDNSWPYSVQNVNQHTPNGYSSYCSDSYYGNYYFYDSNGQEDILIAKPVNVNRETYDYYYRSGTGCIRDFVKCCISNSSSGDVSCAGDSVFICQPPYSTSLTCHTRTCDGHPAFVDGVGPKYRYLWSTGDTARTINVTVSGFYSVTATTFDDCFVSSDSVYVQFNPSPQKPCLTDSKGIHYQYCFPYDIHLCVPDSVMITANNINGNQISWTGPGLPTPCTDSVIWAFYSGYYTIVLTNSFGCTSSNYIHVYFHDLFDTIHPYLDFPQDVDHDDTVDICSDEYLYINGYDSLNIPIFLDNLGTATWYANSNYIGQTSPYVYLYYHPGQTGWYTFSVIIVRKNICDTVINIVSDSIYVIVHPQPVINLSFSGPTYLCPDSVVMLVATGAQTYSWSGPNNFNSTNDTVYVSDQGYYSLHGYATDAFGCTNQDNMNIYINLYPAPLAVMNPVTGLICPGDSVLITVINVTGISYVWYGPNGIPVGYTQSIWVNTPGYYYCYVNDSYGCNQTTNMVEVVQFSTPYIEVSPSQIICMGDSVTLSVVTSPGSSITWLPPLSGSNYTQVVDSAGTYSCYVSSCGIQTVASVTITLSVPVASIYITGNDTICEGDTVTLIGGPSGMYNYQWLPSGIYSQTLNVTQSGIYTLVVTNANGCTATEDAYIKITDNDLPDPIVPDTLICYQTPAILLVSPSGYDYFWYDAPGGNLLYNGNPYITGDLYAPQDFYVQAVDIFCKSILSVVHVTIDHCDVKDVPNIISPNGDGFNDFFKISAIDAEQIICMIYNRWGTPVYKSTGSSFSWDGIIQGTDKPASEGVYYYNASIILYNGEGRLLSGFFHIIK
ncbi:MAG: gliding motility-associated C-terminal domain-containing protein [Bacteroidota bacterium]